MWFRWRPNLSGKGSGFEFKEIQWFMKKHFENRFFIFDSRDRVFPFSRDKLITAAFKSAISLQIPGRWWFVSPACWACQYNLNWVNRTGIDFFTRDSNHDGSGGRAAPQIMALRSQAIFRQSENKRQVWFWPLKLLVSEVYWGLKKYFMCFSSIIWYLVNVRVAENIESNETD